MSDAIRRLCDCSVIAQEKMKSYSAFASPDQISFDCGLNLDRSLLFDRCYHNRCVLSGCCTAIGVRVDAGQVESRRRLLSFTLCRCWNSLLSKGLKSRVNVVKAR